MQLMQGSFAREWLYPAWQANPCGLVWRGRGAVVGWGAGVADLTACATEVRASSCLLANLAACRYTALPCCCTLQPAGAPEMRGPGGLPTRHTC